MGDLFVELNVDIPPELAEEIALAEAGIQSAAVAAGIEIRKFSEALGEFGKAIALGAAHMLPFLDQIFWPLDHEVGWMATLEYMEAIKEANYDIDNWA